MPDIGAMRRFCVAGAITMLIAPAAFAYPRPAVGGVAVRQPECVRRAATSDRSSSWAAPLDRIVTVQLGDKLLRDALESVAAQAKVELSYSSELLPRDRRICLALERVTIGAVLETLLSGTTLRPVVIGATQIVLAPSRATAGLDLGSTTRRASVLDRVVVTGTPDGGSQRGSPFALDVIEGTTLARLHANSLGDALNMIVPGVWSWSPSAGSVTARYGSIRGASSFGVSAPKVYLDGIEVANPLVVTQLDPSRVDRVEVIRGPQGAALYGADAISGVVNILMRHDGTPTGAVLMQLSTSAGMANTSYAPRDAFVQDHALSLRGGGGKRTYGLGFGVGTVGAYVPGASEQRILADADVRIVQSRSILTGTARYSMERANASTNLVLGGLAASVNAIGGGAARASIFSGSAAFDRMTANGSAPDTARTTPPRDSAHFAGDSAGGQQVAQYTLGGTLTMMPSLRWTHTIIAGVDGYRLQGLSSAGLPTPAISGSDLTNAQGAADRGTLRLRTVGRIDMAERTSLNLTFAAEQAVLHEIEDQSGQPVITRNSGTTLGPPSVLPLATQALRTTWAQNGGVSAQANLSYHDAWFFVAGGRFERSTGITARAQTALLPMLGASYVHDVGDVVLKWRAAYGTGIRPVHNLTRGTSWMGRSVVQWANALQPESQSGVEAGADVLFGRSLALHVTRFDQRASGLIQPVAVTSVSATTGGRYVRTMSYLLENVGAITNRGWELQGTTQLDRLALTGTLSLVNSRVARVASGYRGDLRVGDRMLDVPAATTSLSATWTASRWTATTTVSRAQDWIGYDRLAIGQALADTERNHDLGGAMLRNYWMHYAGVTRLRGSMNYRLLRGISLDLSGDNLLNVQRGAPDNATVTVGRTISFGLRSNF